MDKGATAGIAGLSAVIAIARFSGPSSVGTSAVAMGLIEQEDNKSVCATTTSKVEVKRGIAIDNSII
jgi:hypothetical protein